MSFRNKYIFVIFAVIGIASLIYQWVRYSRGEDDYMPLMAPTGKTQTIRASFSERECACPQWKLEDSEGTLKYFYLEPATFDLATPEILANRLDSTTLLTLEGEFLKGKGLPAYNDQVNTKQELADVFRYTNFEITKRN